LSTSACNGGLSAACQLARFAIWQRKECAPRRIRAKDRLGALTKQLCENLPDPLKTR